MIGVAVDEIGEEEEGGALIDIIDDFLGEGGNLGLREVVWGIFKHGEEGRPGRERG